MNNDWWENQATEGRNYKSSTEYVCWIDWKSLSYDLSFPIWWWNIREKTIKELPLKTAVNMCYCEKSCSIQEYISVRANITWIFLKPAFFIIAIVLIYLWVKKYVKKIKMRNKQIENDVVNRN